MNLKKLASSFRRRIFQSAREKALGRWWADGGDYALRFDYPLTEGALALDLGGYRGQWASDLFSRYACRVFIFEPVRSFAERIQKRFCRNPRIKVFQYGLGGKTREEQIGLSEEGSSVFGKTADRETIQIVDVKNWIDEEKIEQIDLMKINIEGGEYELLERLIETKLIGKISSVQVQFHDIIPKAEERMRRIQVKLKETHQPTYQYKFVWENWERRRGLSCGGEAGKNPTKVIS